MRIRGVNSILELILVLLNDVGTFVATADRPFLGLGLLVLVDPTFGGALGAEEVFTGVTEITDVHEIERNVAASSSLAFDSVQSLLE